MLYRSGMPNPQAELEGDHAYKAITDVIEARRKQRDEVLGPLWFQRLLGIAPWFAALVAPALLVVAGTAALSGWGRPMVIYPTMLAVVASLLAFAVWLVAAVGYGLRYLRSKRTRRTPSELIIDDCLVAEQLAVCSELELMTFRHVLAARLDRLGVRQTFALGPAAKISPFLILLLVLLLSRAEIAGVVKQIAPWAMETASSPFGAFAVSLVTFAVVFVRFGVYLKDETLSVDLMLIDAALERIKNAGSTRALADPTPTAASSNVQTANDEDAESQLVPGPVPGAMQREHSHRDLLNGVRLRDSDVAATEKAPLAPCSRTRHASGRLR